ncbi:MAG: hypothetical protein AMR96_01640 [Candidatus Adiutrix intracellularis]|jgi:AcrR family transcriptional regulator|nr:MAG: hypothetical protein AMR96_01640 [Candidatus Adiutrix intracellularis]MDR2827408.1 TetR/AcrR family transcriptional regulator [Candidatus Adiutrix intracellularis]
MGCKKKKRSPINNKRAILTVVNKLVLKNGVIVATIDGIIKTTDYSKSTLYVYFKSEEDILNQLGYEGLILF